MATTSKVEYKIINVTRRVFVEQVGRVPADLVPSTVLIMGPTGSGKSSFIEAFGLEGTPKISSNGLDGCTQTVSSYKLNNAAHGRYPNTFFEESPMFLDRPTYPIYLVDSPGFADPKISDIAIVTMLQKWLKDNKVTFNRVLYFAPITNVRLPGSQKQVLKTFQALTGIRAAKDITIVTTMWDSISGESATKRAEGTYKQLQKLVWKDFIKQGAQIKRFLNTEESALSILDQALASGMGTMFSIEDHINNIKISPFHNNLLADLRYRIQNLQAHVPMLQDELTQPEVQADQLLVSILRRRLQETEEDLARFQQEFNDWGSLPPPLATPAPSASVTIDAVSYPGKFTRIIKAMKCWGKTVGEHHVV